jgi:uncharacterized membrane-anchored protein
MEQPNSGAMTGTVEGQRRHGGLATAEWGSWSKVPEVTAWFWIVKVLTTGVGETTSDYLAKTLGPVVAGAIGLVGLAVLLMRQFRAPRYSAWTYWAAIVMVSVFGTMAADVVHVVAGVPYVVSTVAFSVILAAILMTWYASEGTLSIHSVRTRRRETFYWATVLATFALGTAAGDLIAGSLHLGYFTAGIAFGLLIIVPAVAYRFFRLNAVAAFWWAYILTRPLGASFADWMGVSKQRGGIGWGTGPVSLGLAVPILVLVAYLAVSRKDTPAETTDAGAL